MSFLKKITPFYLFNRKTRFILSTIREKMMFLIKSNRYSISLINFAHYSKK